MAVVFCVVTSQLTLALRAQGGGATLSSGTLATSSAAITTNVSATTLSGGTLTLGGSSVIITNLGSVTGGGTYYGTTPKPRTLGAGSRDVSFGTRRGTDGTVYAVAIQPDGKIIIGGDFKTVDAIPTGKVARLNADGSLDTSFNPGTGADDKWIKAVVVQPDGKLLVAGAFTTFNGVPRPGIARLNADGSLDMTFTPGVMSRISWPEVVAGGPPTSSSYGYAISTPTYTAMPINIGTISLPGSPTAVTTPQYPLLPGGQVNALALQPDGKVFIGGIFYVIDGVVRYNLARLNADGSLDATFDPGLRANRGYNPNYAAAVSALALQPDGRLLVAGNYFAAQYGVQTSLVRLDAGGNSDATFQSVATSSTAPLYTSSTWSPVTGSSYSTSYYDYRYSDATVTNTLGIQALAIQPDGKILAAGIACQFDLSGGKTSGNVARYNADGSPDAGFTASPVGRGVYSLALQADGKVLVAGSYSITPSSSYTLPGAAVSRSGFARLNANGATDFRFETRSLSSSWNSYAVAVQPGDGKVLVGGDFYTMEGAGINGVARLNPTSPTVTVSVDARKISRAAGENAVLTFTRSGDDTSSETTVAYALTGSLQNGTDFSRLSGRAHIKSGETSHAVKIKPTAEGAIGKLNVTLTLGTDYELADQAAAQLKIGK